MRIHLNIDLLGICSFNTLLQSSQACVFIVILQTQDDHWVLVEALFIIYIIYRPECPCTFLKYLYQT